MNGVSPIRDTNVFDRSTEERLHSLGDGLEFPVVLAGHENHRAGDLAQVLPQRLLNSGPGCSERVRETVNVVATTIREIPVAA